MFESFWILRFGVLMAAFIGIAGAAPLCAAELSSVAEDLDSARDTLATGDTAATSSELADIAQSLSETPTPQTAGIRREIQYVALSLTGGDVKGGSAQLDSLIERLSGTVGPAGAPGRASSTRPAWLKSKKKAKKPTAVHNWGPKPPKWWHRLHLPAIVAHVHNTPTDGHFFGMRRGYYDGWNNFPNNPSGDPHWERRSAAFRKAFIDAYNREYPRGHSGQGY